MTLASFAYLKKVHALSYLPLNGLQSNRIHVLVEEAGSEDGGQCNTQTATTQLVRKDFHRVCKAQWRESDILQGKIGQQMDRLRWKDRQAYIKPEEDE